MTDKEKVQVLNQFTKKLVPHALFNLEPNTILQYYHKIVNKEMEIE